MSRKQAKSKPGERASAKAVSTARFNGREFYQDRPFDTQRFCLETRRQINGIQDWEKLLNRDAWPLTETPWYLLGLIPIEFWPKSYDPSGSTVVMQVGGLGGSGVNRDDPSGFEVILEGVLDNIRERLNEAIAAGRIEATEIDGAQYVIPAEVVAVARKWKEPLALFIASEVYAAANRPQQTAGAQDTRRTENDRVLQHSQDYTDVCWRGFEFSLTPKQARVVKRLWENYQGGTPSVQWKTIQEDDSIDSERWDHLFKSQPKRNELIVRGNRKGTLRLRD